MIISIFCYKNVTSNISPSEGLDIYFFRLISSPFYVWPMYSSSCSFYFLRMLKYNHLWKLSVIVVLRMWNILIALVQSLISLQGTFLGEDETISLLHPEGKKSCEILLFMHIFLVLILLFGIQRMWWWYRSIQMTNELLPIERAKTN